MPASQKTPLGFCNWVPEDKPSREDFCGDNQLLDTLLSQHTEDMELHLTAAYRAILQGARMGTYTGNGAESLQFTVPITPKIVIVAMMEVGFSRFTGKVTENYAALAVQGQGQVYTTDGIQLQNSVVTVYENQIEPTEVSYGTINRLNRKGSTYFWIAIP